MPIKSNAAPFPIEDIPQEENDELVNTALNIEVESAPEEVVQEVDRESREQPVKPAQENTFERNARAMRELKEKAEKERLRAEKERDEALRRARELEEKYAHPTQKVDSNDEDFSIGEDDLVEGKHVKKIQQYVKKLENKLNQYEQRSSNQTLQDRIRYDYPDFNKVVTPENIELLKHLRPRQAQLLDSSTDLYATAASAYEMIKEYGIYQEPSVARDRESAQKNLSKPKPTNAISPQRGNSPLTKAHDFANGFNKDTASALYKEMLEATKGR